MKWSRGVRNLVFLAGLLAGVWPVSGDIFRVTAGSLTVAPADYNGSCPHTFTFTIALTTNLAGTVHWRLICNSDPLGGEESTIFASGGTQTLTRSYELGAGSRSCPDCWAMVQISSPSHAGVAPRVIFRLNCRTIEPAGEGRVYVPTRGTISGRISPNPAAGSGSNIGGRRVKITARRAGGGTVTQEHNLNRDGTLDYSFNLLFGTYTVTVEKGANDPGSYASTANWCFDGTDPVSRSGITISAAAPNARSQDFVIRYSLILNHAGWCW